MARVTLNAAGLEDLISRLERASSIAAPDLEAGMQEATGILREGMAEYPDYPGAGALHLGGTNPAPFYSPKQKRFFFYALHAGLIHPGSGERTGGLAASWQQRVEVSSAGLRGVVWTDSPVAKWVQNQTSQAAMFQGYWQPAQQVYQEKREALKESLRAAARNAMRKLIFGG
jgi:hypothetical protein